MMQLESMAASLGKKLAAYRRAAGISQAEAGRLVGVNSSHISRIEMWSTKRESRIPSAELIERLGKVYGLKREDVSVLLRLRAREIEG